MSNKDKINRRSSWVLFDKYRDNENSELPTIIEKSNTRRRGLRVRYPNNWYEEISQSEDEESKEKNIYHKQKTKITKLEMISKPKGKYVKKVKQKPENPDVVPKIIIAKDTREEWKIVETKTHLKEIKRNVDNLPVVEIETSINENTKNPICSKFFEFFQFMGNWKLPGLNFQIFPTRAVENNADPLLASETAPKSDEN